MTSMPVRRWHSMERQRAVNSEQENAEQRPCWFVGASFGGTDDQTDRFLQEGIWENGWHDRHLDQVKSMRPGDRIAIKAGFTQKHALPFPIPEGRTASGMYIKAVGTVTQNMLDGRHVKVNWTPLNPPLEWYFYTYRKTVWEVWPGKGTIPWAADALISFAFDGRPQDYDRFRRRWGWVEDEPSVLETPGDPPASEPPMPQVYSVDSILEDGCFLEPTRLEEILEHFQLKKNLILQGPPGTGKTWLARKLAFALIGHRDESKVQAVQFHPTFPTRILCEVGGLPVTGVWN